MKTSVGVMVSEFYGDGEYEGRRSEVVKYGNKYTVNMFQGKDLCDSIDFENIKVYDIEDIAENWVLGVNN